MTLNNHITQSPRTQVFSFFSDAALDLVGGSKQAGWRNTPVDIIVIST